MTTSTPDRTESGLSWTSGGRRMSEDTRAGRPCPVEDCSERFLSADAAGRHLDRWHDERGRWSANRLTAVNRAGDSHVTLIDSTDGNRWISSDCVVSLGQSDEAIEVKK